MALNELFSDQSTTALRRLISDLAGEFGAIPANVSDMKLSDLAKQLDAGYTRLGATSTSLLETLLSTKIAAFGLGTTFGVQQARLYISVKYELPPTGYVDAIMLGMILGRHAVTSVSTALQAPRCAAVVASEPVCDPRAMCRSRVSGGVQCLCIGDGVQSKQGVVPDGRRCQQVTRVDLHAQSKTIILKAQKPGNHSEKLVATMRAEGEERFAASFSLLVIHSSGSGSWRTVRGNNTWRSMHDHLLSLHGFALSWVTPPSDDAEVDLDAEAGRITASKSYTFQLRLDCGSEQGQLCIADGDTVETVMQVGAASDPSGMRSEVRFVTEVEALVSCKHSHALVEGDLRNLRAHSSLRVRLLAADADSLAVTSTRAEITVTFGNTSLAIQWSRGSNEYVADVRPDLTAQAGEFELVVSASNAWNETVGHATSCELLRRTITVDEGLSTSWILLAAGSAAVFVVGGMALTMRRKRAQLQAIIVMLLTEMGMLVFSICSALANLITDGIVFGLLLRGELEVSSEIYTAAYATILCFGVVSTTLSLGYRIRNARLMRAQLQQLAAENGASEGRRQGKTKQDHVVVISEVQLQLQQTEWELVQTHRTKVTLSLSMMSVVTQGARALRACVCEHQAHPLPYAAELPMSVLNCCLIFVEGSTDKTVRVSLAGREL